MKRKINPEIVGMFCIIMAAISASVYQPYSSILTGDEFSIYVYGTFGYLGSVCFCLVLFIIYLIRMKKGKVANNLLCSFKDYLFTIMSGLSTVGANIFLLTAMTKAAANNVSLITNFEVLITVTLARFIFKDRVEFYNWIAAPFIVSGAILLSVNFNSGGIEISTGSLYALGACVCWSLENNFSRLVSHRNPYQVTGIKHLIAFIIDMIIATSLGFEMIDYKGPLMAFGIGTLSLGLAFVLYVNAQKRIGAARSTVLFSLSTFLGSTIYLLVMRNLPDWNYYLGAALICLGQITILCFTIYKSKKASNQLIRNFEDL